MSADRYDDALRSFYGTPYSVRKKLAEVISGQKVDGTEFKPPLLDSVGGADLPSGGPGVLTRAVEDGATSWETAPPAEIIDGSVTPEKLSFDPATQAELGAALVEKSNIGHTHAIEDTTGLQAALDAKVPESGLTAHEADTADVHGIEDTSQLITEGDARLSDARTPTGTAGGVLSGTYPNPSFAADLATQAELDAHADDTASVHGIEDTSQLIVEGDTRLSDSRPPTAHAHPVDDLGTGTPSSGKYLDGGGAWTTLPAGGESAPDADATTKGLVQLAGDLGGTAAAPTVPALTDKLDIGATTALTNLPSLTLGRTQNQPVTGKVWTLKSAVVAKQSGTVTDGSIAARIDTADATDVVERTVTGATNASPIEITTSVAHGFATGDRIIVDGVEGNTAANGLRTITVTGSTTFTLDGIAGNGTYTSGGIATNRGLIYGVHIAVQPRVNRGGIASVVNGDDVVGLSVINNSPNANGTEAIYLGTNPTLRAANGKEFNAAIGIDTWADKGINLTGTYQYGLMMHTATITTAAITIPNNATVQARNAGNTANTTLFRLDASDRFTIRNDAIVVATDGSIGVNTTAPAFNNAGAKGLHVRQIDGTTAELRVASDTAASATGQVSVEGRAASATVHGRFQASSGGIIRMGSATNHNLEIQHNSATKLTLATATLTFADALNVALNATTGTKIGTATTQKLGFWNATPVVRPTGWAAATGTATRTAFATGTVTLPLLAERVKALIDDLTTIGIIGA